MKFVVVALVVALGVWLFIQRSDRRDAVREQQRNTPPRKPKASSRMTGSHQMLACAHCDVVVPAKEMIRGKSGLYYCSLDHCLAHRDVPQA